VLDGACWLDAVRLVLFQVWDGSGWRRCNSLAVAMRQRLFQTTRHLSLLGMRWVGVLSRAREKRDRNGISHDEQGTQAYAPDAAMVAPE